MRTSMSSCKRKGAEGAGSPQFLSLQANECQASLVLHPWVRSRPRGRNSAYVRVAQASIVFGVVAGRDCDSAGRALCLVEDPTRFVRKSCFLGRCE